MRTKVIKYNSKFRDKIKSFLVDCFKDYLLNGISAKENLLKKYKTEEGYSAGIFLSPLLGDFVRVEFTKEEFEELIDEIYMVTKDEEEQVLKPVMEFDEAVDIILSKVGKTLKEKNESYGNAALKPIRVFSKADALEQIKVRLDDKLSRISRGKEYGQEDTYLDILGYLVLHEIHKNYAVK